MVEGKTLSYSISFEDFDSFFTDKCFNVNNITENNNLFEITGNQNMLKNMVPSIKNSSIMDSRVEELEGGRKSRSKKSRRKSRRKSKSKSRRRKQIKGGNKNLMNIILTLLLFISIFNIFTEGALYTEEQFEEHIQRVKEANIDNKVWTGICFANAAYTSQFIDEKGYQEQLMNRKIYDIIPHTNLNEYIEKEINNPLLNRYEIHNKNLTKIKTESSTPTISQQLGLKALLLNNTLNIYNILSPVHNTSSNAIYFNQYEKQIVLNDFKQQLRNFVSNKGFIKSYMLVIRFTKGEGGHAVSLFVGRERFYIIDSNILNKIYSSNLYIDDFDIEDNLSTWFGIYNKYKGLLKSIILIETDLNIVNKSITNSNEKIQELRNEVLNDYSGYEACKNGNNYNCINNTIIRNKSVENITTAIIYKYFNNFFNNTLENPNLDHNEVLKDMYHMHRKYEADNEKIAINIILFIIISLIILIRNH